MGRESTGSRQESDDKWAGIWFASLARFHRIEEPGNWQFDEGHVIAFLRESLKLGMPTWKRLKVVNALIVYRDRVRQSANPRLESIRTTLAQRMAMEKNREQEVPIEDIVGKINPREPDLIQDLRRTLRLQGLKYSTEKAYVGKVRAFMSERGLKCRADFDDVGGKEVEEHLTDLAVDGNVAPSTQNQAFSALLFLYQHVLKRDFGRINAWRSTKAPRIPSVMSVSEVTRVLDQLQGTYLLMAQLLYGCGMRISECFVLLSFRKIRGRAIGIDTIYIRTPSPII